MRPPSTRMDECPSPSARLQSFFGPPDGQLAASPVTCGMKSRPAPPHCSHSSGPEPRSVRGVSSIADATANTRIRRLPVMAAAYKRTNGAVISWLEKMRWTVVLRACVLGILVSGVSVFAHDWPQFLGPQRNGVYSGPRLASSWPAGGPQRVWRRTVRQWVAGPVVAGDRVILFHRVGNEELVEALDARTGEPRWRFAYPTTYRDDFAFDA